MKRGFIGQIISSLNIEPTYKNIRVISSVVLLILFFSFSSLMYKALQNLNIKNNEVLKYSMLILFLPFTTTEWILEIGRFDQFFQIILILSTIFLIKSNNPYINFLIIFFSLPLIGLIHEAGLIIFAPTLILTHYLKFKRLDLAIIIFIELIICIILMIKFGKIDFHQSALIIQKYEEYKKFNEYAVTTSTLSLKENILCSYYAFMNLKMYIPVILAGLYISPLFIFFQKTFHKNTLFLLLFTLSPLALYLIAFDYFRWISLSLFNLAIVIFYLISENKIDISLIKINLLKYNKLIIIYCCTSLLLGPLGVFNLFPNFHFSNTGGLAPKEMPDEILTKINFPIHDAGLEISTISNFTASEPIDLQKRAIAGDSDAQNALATLYYESESVKDNYKNAFFWFNKAALSGNPSAQNNLGVMYASGKYEKKQSSILAYNWYLSSAQQGDISAQFNIGTNYLYGLNGFEKNQSEAKKWLKKAAFSGHKKSQLLILNLES